MKFLNTIFNSLCIADTAPVVDTITVGLVAADNVIVITFDKAIDVYEVPSEADFAITFSGGDVVISAVQISAGDNNPVSITLDRVIEYGETGTIAYAGTTLRGENGKTVASFTEDIVNNVEEVTLWITEWINSESIPYDTLTSSADEITDGELLTDTAAQADTNTFDVAAGVFVEINFTMTVSSGEVPTLTIYDGTFTHDFGLADGGDGYYYIDWEEYEIPAGSSGTLTIKLTNTLATAFVVTDLTVREA